MSGVWSSEIRRRAAADGEAVITDTAIAGKSTAASNVMMRKCRPE